MIYHHHLAVIGAETGCGLGYVLGYVHGDAVVYESVTEIVHGEGTKQPGVLPVIEIESVALVTIRLQVYGAVCASGIVSDGVVVGIDFWIVTAWMRAPNQHLACMVHAIDTAFAGVAAGASTACRDGTRGPS